MYYADHGNKTMIVTVPKSASNTLRRIIELSSWARMLEFGMTQDEAFASGYSIPVALVRNPVARALSFNTMPWRVESGNSVPDAQFVEELLAGAYAGNPHLIPQHTFYPATPATMIKLEDFPWAYMQLCDIVGCRAEQPHKNKSDGPSWQDRFAELTKSLRDALRAHYADDFVWAGYY